MLYNAQLNSSKFLLITSQNKQIIQHPNLKGQPQHLRKSKFSGMMGQL